MEIADSVLNLPTEPRMLDVVREGLSDAKDVRIAVAFTRCSGLALVRDELRGVMSRGGSVRVLTSTYQNVTQPAALDSLLALASSGVETRLQDGPVGFHAKFWWFSGGRSSRCWAGSSNLTKGGLDTNVEWNIRRSDDPSMRLTASQFDALWSRSDVRDLDAEAIRAYGVRCAEAGADRRATLVGDHGPIVRPNEVQLEALAELAALRARGGRRAAIIAATGVGKTYLAAFDARASGARSVLFVSHRLEHLLQAERAFRAVFTDGRRFGVVGGGRRESEADVVFSTVIGVLLDPSLAARTFDYLVIDEFHHVEAPSYEVLRPIRERAFLLGMTATPERQDGRDILEWTDRSVALEVRLPEAIDRGWLLPFHYFGVADETIDFADFPWRRLDQIEDRLSVEARAEYVLTCAIERGFDGPKRATIGFCAGRRHASFMADAFRRRRQVAEVVLGDQGVAERESIYRRLANPSDPLQWVFVADVLNEGVDIPAINSVLFLRPTESSTLFLQQLGRGLRLFPGTEVLTVLDFVGHHRSAWLPIRSLDAPGGNGRRVEVTPGVVMQPPLACEVVLERRTREILEKIKRFTSRREECDHAYLLLREELGRTPMPTDLSRRADVPKLSAFRAAYGSWIDCQRHHGDEPLFAVGRTATDAALVFLNAIELDWQAQRVAPYALVWGLAQNPHDPVAGFEEFFVRHPYWSIERVSLDDSKTWATVRRKLERSLDGVRLADAVLGALGDRLLPEVEGRLLYTIDSDYRSRHEGARLHPSDLHVFDRYDRPDVIRHFGTHYDPTKHNKGVIWFDDDCAIIAKLDTSTAKTRYQYGNRILDDRRFSWTSQNQMAPDNATGRRVVEHAKDQRRLHLFVQSGSHERAFYLGQATVLGVEGSKPMTVTMQFDRPIPDDVRRELEGETSPV